MIDDTPTWALWLIASVLNQLSHIQWDRKEKFHAILNSFGCVIFIMIIVVKAMKGQ